MAIVAPSPKLQALLKDFQQIASMSGYLNHSFDPPQLRLFFTLYGRVMVASPEQGMALTPQLQTWCDAVSARLREGSSGTIMQPQIQISAPQSMPDGRDYIVATVTFNTKVTETSYLRIRNAVLVAYQDAVKMRELGFSAEAMPEPMVTGNGLPASPAGEIGTVPE